MKPLMGLSQDWGRLPAWQKITLLAILTALLSAPRILELDRFVTPDEPLWLARATNFMLAIKDSKFDQTYQKEHPGVTTMWAGMFGYLWKYPQFLEEREGPLTRRWMFQILKTTNHPPLELLAAGRVFVVLGIVLTLVVSFPAAARLVGLIPALAGYLLLILDPFSIALSRLLHVDGLLSAFMFLSLLSFIAYLFRGRRILDLLISGGSAGLAWLTKSPAFFLIPFVCLLGLFDLFNHIRGKRGLSWRSLGHISWPYAAWFFIAVMTFFLLWPAMWVAPIDSIQGILSGAVHYAEEGHVHPIFFDGHIFSNGKIDSWYFYPLTFLWRTTPIILLGLVSASILGILRQKIWINGKHTSTILILSLFVLLYTVFMSLGTKKFDRYLLPVFAPVCLIAGTGLFYGGMILWRQVNRLLKPKLWARISLMAVVLLLTGVSTLPGLRTFPYYFSYYNPLLGGAQKALNVMMVGWGEGLDQAARYINGLPDGEDAVVVSWYNEGCFSFFFNGRRRSLDLFSPDYASLPDADYIVLYVHQWQRGLPSLEYLANFDNHEPVYTVTLNGIPYAKIYNYSP